jgi:hypothetical protein
MSRTFVNRNAETQSPSIHKSQEQIPQSAFQVPGKKPKYQMALAEQSKFDGLQVTSQKLQRGLVEPDPEMYQVTPQLVDDSNYKRFFRCGSFNPNDDKWSENDDHQIDPNNPNIGSSNQGSQNIFYTSGITNNNGTPSNITNNNIIITNNPSDKDQKIVINNHVISNSADLSGSGIIINNTIIINNLNQNNTNTNTNTNIPHGQETPVSPPTSL